MRFALFTSARLVGVLCVGFLLVGCNDRPPHEYVQQVTPPDASPPDLITGTGGRAAGGGSGTGSGGVLGGTGGRGGTGGSGVCVPTNNGHETCGDIGVDNNCDGNANDVDPGELTDPANCGACFNLCNQANATDFACVPDAVTNKGKCAYTCLNGFVDANVDPADGCECQITSTVELCNGKDDNCNNMIDEGFDLTTDTTNCGRCGVTCTYPFAKGACAAGVCAMGTCLAGFFDANHSDADGCECQKTNGGVEVCDGIDNNCDGRIDEPTGLTSAPACKSKGVCAGITPTCHGMSGWSCDYPASYQQVEDMTKNCDGLDNDCDGLTDEAFDIGKACQVGTGPCAGMGVWKCDSAGVARVCNGSMKTPQPEVCDGVDNDCDGTVDELTSATTDEKVVYYPAPKNLSVFAYEATRFDATDTSAGVVSNHRPCSVGGKVPWANVTASEAAAACAMIGTGWRLCTAAEWQDACNGPSNTAFPYGATYNPAACVGYDYSTPAPTGPLATGAATACVSDASPPAGAVLYDMSGNVKEWASNSALTPPYEIRGGAYDIASFTISGMPRSAVGLQCDSGTPAPKDSSGNAIDVRLPSVGFRCCLTGQVPAN
jgi:hypothetical protein